MPGRLAELWYETAYVVTHMLFTLALSLRTYGRRNIPASGPVLVIANHSSALDPVLVGLSTRRHLCFLARKTLFRNRFFAELIGSLNAVPINQERLGKEGLQAILTELRKGQAVLVFPEGTRTPDGFMNPFKPGVQLLIRRAQCPIVPVGIAGAFEAWPYWRWYPKPAPLFFTPGSATVAVCVGAPLDGKRHAQMEKHELQEKLFAEVKAQKDRAEQLRRKI